MQLMPATAAFIAQKRFSGRNRNQLYDPALNMSLGQKYILHLMDNDHIKGDLLLIAAAYNGGPGNLKKWQRRAKRNDYDDGLMFIESIPARETRIFIERVLSNLWMYRERLDEPSPSSTRFGGQATVHLCRRCETRRCGGFKARRCSELEKKSHSSRSTSRC